MERIKWIDQAKGIGIILVVLGHMSIPDKLSTVIFAFHMPLFFIISGLLFNEKKYSSDFLSTLISKSNSLVWPYFTFTLIYAMLKGLFLWESSLSYIKFILTQLVAALPGIHSLDTPLWFLTALFSTEIIFSQIRRFDNRISVMIVIILSVFGFINARFWRFDVLFNANIAVIALLFYMLGFVKQMTGYFIWFDRKIFQKSYGMMIIVFTLMGTVLLAMNNVRIDMQSNTYGNPLIFLIAALSGSYAVMLSAYIFNGKNILNKFIEYCGKNSLIILATHGVYPDLIRSVIGELPLRVDRLLSILWIYLTIEFINRFAPYIVKLPIRYRSTQQKNVMLCL